MKSACLHGKTGGFTVAFQCVLYSDALTLYFSVDDTEPASDWGINRKFLPAPSNYTSPGKVASSHRPGNASCRSTENHHTLPGQWKHVEKI